MDPVPDGAHAVGAPLRSATPTSAPRPPRIQSQRQSEVDKVHGGIHGLALPYHPHIQHTNLGITSIYLQGIDNTEIIDTVNARRAPMVPVDSSLRR
jgi:hypothetical protein